MDCKYFSCVYAMKYGCIIKGHLDEEGEKNGKKQHCKIYNVMCVSAKCNCCRHFCHEKGCDRIGVENE